MSQSTTSARHTSSARRHTVSDSPVGPLTLVAEDGALAGLYQDGQRHLPSPEVFGERDDRVLPVVREQLSAYFAGELTAFDVPLALAGTPFQAAVWRALQEVPYATTCTYGELALAVGRPTAVRAVGAANGRNPVCIVVPCHRVVGADGALTGYAGGTDRKRFLLDHERGLPTGWACRVEPSAVGSSEALLDARTRALAAVEDLTADLAQMMAASESSNADDEHDPEGATIAFERAQVTSLLAQARARLVDVDHALARLELGEYGRCSGCGEPIGAERLAARPATRTCRSCADRRR